jgi:hypothetical protein
VLPNISKYLFQSKAVWLLIVIFSILTFKLFTNWGTAHHPFTMDVNQYYGYLPALFKQHDLTFSVNPNNIWLTPTPICRGVPMVTYGMSIFYLPFYAIASVFSASNSTGYEPIYAWTIHIGCIIYVLIGLHFCRKTLLTWFSEQVTSIVLLVIFFGTNLFCYTLINSELTHSILFFLISMFVFYVVRWHQSSEKKYFLVFCFLLGFITLIRPTEMSVAVFPLLIGVTSFSQFKEKILTIFGLKFFLLIGIILFVIPIFPQLLYWKIQSGQWLFFSYGNNERFYWFEPQFFNVLFSYRKGWLLYSPLMLLSLLGFVQLFKKNKAIFWSIIIYFLINLYLISAWWDWAFGGAFGMRALVQVSAVLIIPLAYFIQWFFEVIESKYLKIAGYIIIVFFCFLNVFQSNLYKHGIISYDGMTKEAYWFTFLKKNYSKEDLLYLETLVKHPDYAAMRQGKRDE